MINYADFVNAEDSSQYIFVNDADPSYVLRAAPTSIEFDIDERLITDRNRMQRKGTNPTYSYEGGMHINITGDLFHDTPEDYVTERLLLVSVLRGAPDITPSFRKSGVFTIGMSGQDELFEIDCQIEKLSAPLTGLYPTYTEYMLTLFAFKPWFTGVDSGFFFYVD